MRRRKGGTVAKTYEVFDSLKRTLSRSWWWRFWGLVVGIGILKKLPISLFMSCFLVSSIKKDAFSSTFLDLGDWHL